MPALSLSPPPPPPLPQLNTLEFIVGETIPGEPKPPAPHFTWSTNSSLLFTLSFGTTMLALGAIHLCCDVRKGGNVPRFVARVFTACAAFMSATLIKWGRDPSGAVEYPLTHLTIFTVAGFANAYYDTLGLQHFWRDKDEDDDREDADGKQHHKKEARDGNNTAEGMSRSLLDSIIIEEEEGEDSFERRWR